MENDDIIFIPTLSNTDFKALKKLISENEPAGKVLWHLVFRRNLFTGREPDYDLRDQGMLDLRRMTYEVLTKAAVYRQVRFYTDTEKLTEQYDLMNTVKFYTLPIPVNPELQKGSPRLSHYR